MSLLELFGQARIAVDMVLGSKNTQFFASAPSVYKMYHKLIHQLAARASIIEKRLEKNETRRRIREEKNE